MEHLADEFTRKGQKTTVLASMQSKSLAVEEDFSLKDNIRIKRVWMSLPRSAMGYLVFCARFPLAIMALIKYIRQNKPDLINFHFPDDASLYVFIISRIFKDIPLITNIHGNDIIVFARKPFYRYLIQRILKRSKFIFVNSNYMRKEIAGFDASLEKKVVIIPNGLDLKYIESVAESKLLPKPYIFYVGRLVHKKGVDVLLRAFKIANISNLGLVVEGMGEELDALKKLSLDLGIEDKVVFTEGKLSHDQKIAAMKGSLFGVIPSRKEPFGIVSLEFLAAGVPLIASQTGGLVDLLKDRETCLFFENESIQDLTKRLKEMADNNGLRTKLSVNGRDVAQKYGWPKIADQYISKFSEIV